LSDGWQDLKAHNKMTWDYDRAENGNVALIAEIDLLKTNGTSLLAIGFGNNSTEAAQNASASLKDEFERSKHESIAWVGGLENNPSSVKTAGERRSDRPDSKRAGDSAHA
jgi:GH15 family glucan-1,4-alpha-glucosidase